MYIILKAILVMRSYLIQKKYSKKNKKTSLELDKDQLANNILELTINDDRKIIEAAIRLYKDL